MSKWMNNLTIGKKFFVLLASQIVLLLGISILGLYCINQVQGWLAEIAVKSHKAKVIGLVLNDMNVIRTIHVSMIAAAKNEAYLAKRSTRLKEYEARVAKDIEELQSLKWSAEGQLLTDKGLAATRKYLAGFPVALAQAKAAKGPEADTALMEANVGDARESREIFEKHLARNEDMTEGIALQSVALSGRIKALMVAFAGLAVLLGSYFSRLIGKGITTAVQEVEATMHELNHGNLGVTCKVMSRDELGHIAGSLNQTIASLRNDIHEISLAAEGVASSATELAATADQINSTTEEIRKGAEAQRGAMASSSAAMEEMYANTKQVQANTERAEGLAVAAVAATDKGVRSVQVTNTAMAAIRESSENVNRITGVIQEIARQTNLLSLNAAIEAAKAAAHGKGFAVVAEEVRKLSERSANAAKEITAQTQESRDRVQLGTSSAAEAEASLSLIGSNIHDHASLIQQIAAAMGEQGRASQDVVQAMEVTSGMVERNASATIQLAASMQETTRTTDELARLAGRLKQLTAKFRLA